MARPRAQLVPSGDAERRYYCVQRCVQRAFLCGDDALTGRNFEHRKEWIRDRLHLLGECFAVAIHAYAVMGNHLHPVLQLDTATTAGWSDEAVASRWVRLFPPRENTDAARELKRQHLLSTPYRLATVRERLGNFVLVHSLPGRTHRSQGQSRRWSEKSTLYTMLVQIGRSVYWPLQRTDQNLPISTKKFHAGCDALRLGSPTSHQKAVPLPQKAAASVRKV